MRGEFECTAKGCNFRVGNVEWPETSNGKPAPGSFDVEKADWLNQIRQHHLDTGEPDRFYKHRTIPGSGHGTGLLDLGKKFGKIRVVFGRVNVCVDNP